MGPTIDKSSTLLLLLVVLGAGVPLARQAASAPPSPSRKPGDAVPKDTKADGPGEKSDAPEDSLPATLLRGLNEIEGRIGAAAAPTLGDFGRTFQVDTMVATVPNPGVGHLAVYFDQAVDALISAAAAEDYLRDRHWFPWHVDGVDGATAAEGASSPAKAAKPPRTLAKPDLVPGFILFRHEDRSGRRILVVFLVGESAVYGLSNEALAKALAASHELKGEGPRYVLGPFFSGSARALGQALRAEPTPSIVVTGSATASSVKDDMAGTDFSSRVVSDQELFRFFITKVADASGASASPIALLAETDTLFGATFLAQGGTTPIHRFSFPLHVAELRAAHGAGDEPEPKKQNLSHSLELKLDDKSSESQDLTPAYSNLTTFEVEISIRQTLAAISRLGVQYLVIVATDVTDLIFLAREARKYCPGVQLVTLEADQLLTHPDLLRDLSGMLVASTYPLFLENQRRADADGKPIARDRKLFSSEAAEGVYNAALDLFRRRDPRRSKGLPFDDATLDGTVRGNQMWLSRVSNGRFWPIATAPAKGEAPLFPDAANGADGAAPSGALAPVRPTYFASGVGLLLLFGAICYLSYLLLGRSGSHGQGIRARFQVWSASPYLLAKGQYLAASLLAPGILGLVALYPAWRLALGKPCGLGLALTVLGTVTDLLLLITAGIVFVLTARSPFYPCRQKLDHRLVPATAVALAMICLLILGVGYVGSVVRMDVTGLSLLLLRIGDPFGVCPLGPLFYIAGGFSLWAMLGLRRVCGIEQFPDEAPLPDCQDIATPRLADLMVRMQRGPQDGRDWIFRIKIIVVGLFVVPACFFFGHLLPTFEGRWFDALFKAAFLALYGTVLLTFVHFIVLTRLLRTFLRRMAALPMIEAYDRVAHKVTGTFGFQLHARVPEVADLDVARASATALAGLAKRFAYAGPGKGVSAHIADNCQNLTMAATAIDQAFEGNTTKDDDTKTKAVHSAFFAASRTVFGILDGIWRKRAEALDLSRLSAVSPAEAVVLGGAHSKVPTIAVLWVAGDEVGLFWSRLAEDFVAMRVATFIIHVLGQVRTLMLFALSAALLLVASVVAYPFHPSRFITVFTWVLVIVVTGGCFLNILRLEKDEIMSRLAGTEPGRINLRPELISKLVIYVALPLVGLLTALFPEVSDLLSSWIDPLRNLLP